MAHTTEPSLCSRYGKKFTHVIPSNLSTTYEFSSSIISISQMRKLRQREVKEVHKDSFVGELEFSTYICLILESLLLLTILN